MQIKNQLKNISHIFTQYKTPILYSGGSIAKSIAQLVVGLVMARFISPNDLGIWSAISLVLTYSVFLQAGVINGLNLELPTAYGKGEEDKATMMAGTVQTFTLLSSSLILVLGFVYLLFFPAKDIKIKWGVITITAIIILSYYQNYLGATFRSKSSFLKLSFIQIVEALINLTSLILVIYFSYYGMLIKAFLVLFVPVLLLHFSRPIKVGLLWDKATFMKILKIGLPIFGLVSLDALSSTADKLFLINYSSLNEVGLYSFGLYALSTFSMFALSVASYIYPRMTYNYGKTNDKKIIWTYVKKITRILFIAQIPLAIIGYYLIPHIVNSYFPKYTLGITTMQILLIAGLFKGSIVGVNALWSMKSWKYMIIYQTIYSTLLFSLTFIGIEIFQNKIEGVAYGVLFANLLNFISGLYLTFLATNSK